jgi:hypothetical protein
MRAVMLRLVRLTASGVARERVAHQALIPAPGAAPARSAAHEKVLSLLLERSLVVAGEQAGEPTIEAAHEALVRAWPRFADWIEEDRDFLEWRARVGVAVGAWLRNGRSGELVLRGPALDDAEARLRERSSDLNESEASYIRASLQARGARGRSRIVVRLVSAASAAAVVAGAAGAYFGWSAASENLQKARDATDVALEQARRAEAQAAEAQNTVLELRKDLEALQAAALTAAAKAATSEAERRRAEKAALDLAERLDRLQDAAAKNARLSSDWVRELEQTQRTYRK